MQTGDRRTDRHATGRQATGRQSERRQATGRQAIRRRNSRKKTIFCPKTFVDFIENLSLKKFRPIISMKR
jgi:hypothetical protein